MAWFKDYDPNWDEEFQFEVNDELAAKLMTNFYLSKEKWSNIPVKSRFRSEREVEREKENIERKKQMKEGL